MSLDSSTAADLPTPADGPPPDPLPAAATVFQARQAALDGSINGQSRALNAERPKVVDVRRHARVAQAQAQAQALYGPALLDLEESQRRAAARREPIARPLPLVSAVLATLLLMGASYFTVHQVMAQADLPELEAYLLPLAFGPVFVLATKLAVGGWLAAAPEDEPTWPRKRTIALWVVAPALVVAALMLVVGIGVKSMAIGALEPLSEARAQASSLLVFAGLILGELAGAAALASRQYTPGAREYEHAERAYLWSRRAAARSRKRADRAWARSTRAEARDRAWQDWAAGRGDLGRLEGLRRYVAAAPPGDPLVAQAQVETVTAVAPPARLLPSPTRTHGPASPPAGSAATGPASVVDLRAEFLRRSLETAQPQPEQHRTGDL